MDIVCFQQFDDSKDSIRPCLLPAFSVNKLRKWLYKLIEAAELRYKPHSHWMILIRVTNEKRRYKCYKSIMVENQLFD